MSSRIVVFGATGFTGRLVSAALAGQGVQPLLAARDAAKLDSLANALGGEVDTAVADVADPASIKGLLSPGDALVTTVGPFLRFGDAAAEAAVSSGAHYLDTTGEPPFARRVFEHHGPAAERSGAAMLTAFGYDFVPGNLAGALALEEAGSDAVRLDCGYFLTTGGGRRRAPVGLPSGGTRASLLGVLPERGFAWRGGRLVEERAARRVRSFAAGGRRFAGIGIGASEHLALPRSFPQLEEVNVYLGWFHPFSRAVQAASFVGAGALRLPGTRRLLDRAAARAARAGGGPSRMERARWSALVFGVAYDAHGQKLAEVVLDGPEPYTFTADLVAWGAMRAAEGEVRGAGALGPVEAFGVDALREGCARAGLRQSDRRLEGAAA